MYKVFFKDRVVFLGEDLYAARGVPDEHCHRFTDTARLRELVFSFSRNGNIPGLYLYHPNMPLMAESFRSCFKCIDAGGGVVLNDGNEFLVIKRNGVWDLPKGKLEKGEDFETAALREVTEETGLTGLEVRFLIVSTFHTYPLGDDMVLKETRWFEMRYREKGNPVLQVAEGITGYRWVKPGKTGFIRKKSYGSILDVLKISGLL